MLPIGGLLVRWIYIPGVDLGSVVWKKKEEVAGCCGTWAWGRLVRDIMLLGERVIIVF